MASICVVLSRQETGHRPLRVVCENHVKGHAKVDVLSTDTGVSITYLKQRLSGPVDIDRVQLVSHGRLLTSGPLKESLGLLTPTQVLTLTPKVLGAGKRRLDDSQPSEDSFWERVCFVCLLFLATLKLRTMWMPCARLARGKAASSAVPISGRGGLKRPGEGG